MKAVKVRGHKRKGATVKPHTRSKKGAESKKGSGEQYKVKKVMHEFKHGELHSGSKSGPAVKNRKQAIAIALSEQKKYDKRGYKK